VHIDEEKCDGCGLCIPSCEEGALKIIDGKARLVKDIYCDGLGNCLGHCPQDAITIIEREAEPFDEEAVEEYLQSEQKIVGPLCTSEGEKVKSCAFTTSANLSGHQKEDTEAELTHWPIQLGLVSPEAKFITGQDLLIAADCVPFAFAEFHQKLLAGYSLIIGCPKLDDTNLYHQKLVSIFKNNKPKSIKVAHMEVGCCFGLSRLVKGALAEAGVAIPYSEVIVGVDGSMQGSC